MSYQSLVVEQIQSYLNGTNRTLNATAIQVAMERLKRSLENQFSSVRSERDPNQLKLYPSEAGKCERMIQYKALGIPGEPMLADVQFKLAMGDLIELALMYVISVTPNLTVTDNNTIRDITIGGRKWRGATDGIHRDEKGKRRNLEVKSASGIGFKMTIKNGVDDNFGYLTQASVYTRQLLEDKAIDEPETIFVYIDRDSMKLWETVVPYSPELARAADEKFLRVIDAVQKKKLLPRPYQLKEDGSLPLNCSYCNQKYTCWTTPKQVVTFDERMRPVYRVPPEQMLILNATGRKPLWYVVDKGGR